MLKQGEGMYQWMLPEWPRVGGSALACTYKSVWLWSAIQTSSWLFWVVRMPRKSKALPGPSRLSGILADLKQNPRLELNASVQSLKLKFAARNDHFGARHFVKEQLPRVRYANPKLNIEVAKVPKSKTEMWQPELTLTFDNSTKIVPLGSKWSTTIIKDLMDLAGAPSWTHWKRHAMERGEPIIPGEEFEGVRRAKVAPKVRSHNRPTLKVKSVEGTEVGTPVDAVDAAEVIPTRKTGAAAVLP